MRNTNVPQTETTRRSADDLLGDISDIRNAAPSAKGTALNLDLARTNHSETAPIDKPRVSMERLRQDSVARWAPFAIGNPDAPGDKAPMLASLRKNGKGKFTGAKSNDSSTWATFAHASAAAKKLGGNSGVGIMLGILKNNVLVGVDLDTCRVNSEFLSWAQTAIDTLDTYAEISPSGTGAKLFFLIALSDSIKAKALLAKHGNKFKLGNEKKHPPAIEIYVEDRFFTVTGDRCSEAIDLAVLSVSDLEWLISHARKSRADDDAAEGTTDSGSEADWIAEIKQCSAAAHDSMLRLATKRVFAGATKFEIMSELRALLDSVPATLRKRDDGTDRWKDRYASVPKIARDALKFKSKTERETLERLNDIDWDDLSYLDDQEESAITDIAGFDLSQNGLIEVFRNKFLNKFRYDHDNGKWYEWTGDIWRRNTTQMAHEYARQVAIKLADIAPKNPAIKPLKLVATWDAVERGARRVAPFAVNADAWDRNPWLLGTPAGTVEMKTGEIRESRQSDLITKQTAVAPISIAEFDPERDCPTWLGFLEFALNGDAAAIRFLQQWLGYSLTGDTREQALLFVHGPGGSGKGTAINGFADVMGDYATNVDMSTLTAAKYEGHTTQFARLRGARMARASETEEGKAWAENRIKTLTGGDKVTARFMRQDDFEFVPEFKLTIFGNNRPAILNVDEAIKRRFNVLPFTQIPKVKDLSLSAKLRAEWPAMLTWAILGCLDWQKHGLKRPQVVLDATASYFAEQDTFQLWIDTECETDKRYAATIDDLWRSWDFYSHNAGEPSGSKIRAFPEQMQRRGFQSIKDKMGIRGRGFAGIRVLSEFKNLEHDDMDP